MGILEGILYTVWRGLAIGIIISAPMGPVGILCVQRTLDKGRKTGLYTGVGAAISDLMYCLLTGFGLSFIEDFLERNSNIIQFIGSLVLIGFGIYLFKSNPSRKLKKPVEQKIPAGRNILNGFLFTVSNPLIIFLIIGLFARFNFLLPENQFYHYFIGFVSIFIGALIWWYFVTYFVDKVRAHFNLRSMWLINKIIGSVIFVFAIVGIVTAVSGLASASRPAVYMNSRRGFSLFRNATGSALVIDNKNDSVVTDMMAVTAGADIRWQFRAANRHACQGKRYGYDDGSGKISKCSYPAWGIVMKGGGETTVISFKTHDDRFDETYSSPYVEMCVKVGDEVCERKKIFSDFDLYHGENAFQLLIGADGWKLRGGNRNYKDLAEYEAVGMKPDSIGYAVWPGGELEIDHVSVEFSGTEETAPVTQYSDIKEIGEYLSRSVDPMEGIWAVYDRMLEDNYLRMGGDYRLAIIRAVSGYDLIYVDGAIRNPDKWSVGMRKGRLLTGPFSDVYDVEWIGVSGEVIGGIKAQYEEPLLKLFFPEQSSELRLKKVTLSR